MKQVKFDIAAAFDQLCAAVIIGPGLVVMAFDQFGVNVAKGHANVFGEGEILIQSASR